MVQPSAVHMIPPSLLILYTYCGDTHHHTHMYTHTGTHTHTHTLHSTHTHTHTHTPLNRHVATQIVINDKLTYMLLHKRL